jgi:hypothetical protein
MFHVGDVVSALRFIVDVIDGDPVIMAQPSEFGVIQAVEDETCHVLWARSQASCDCPRALLMLAPKNSVHYVNPL